MNGKCLETGGSDRNAGEDVYGLAGSAFAVSFSSAGDSFAEAHAMKNEIKNDVIEKIKNATSASKCQIKKWNVVPLTLPPMPCKTTDFFKFAVTCECFLQSLQT